MDIIKVPLKREVFERLKGLAEPLVDDASSVIERLIKHWESVPHGSNTRVIAIPESLKVWRSARGEKFPVGIKLRSKYLSHSFEATVTSGGIEFNGRTYDNPSSAGIAAKQSVGTHGNSANTNGWNFWEMQDPETLQWTSIDVLRSQKN
ncbi:hypothetical protein [Polaromonas sp. YR568]|uniref:hypothetical protein n=1 Tax=Polaromonas sp. YR568 TaxID=1855301 RepID=UPI00398C1A44